MAAPSGSLKTDATTVKEGWLQKRGRHHVSCFICLMPQRLLFYVAVNSTSIDYIMLVVPVLVVYCESLSLIAGIKVCFV